MNDSRPESPDTEPQTDTDKIATKTAKNWLLIGLIGFWATEILFIQHWTTFPEASIPVDRAIKDAARRMVLNIAACTALVCWLNRWSLRVAFLFGFLATNGLLVYASYFGSPLSWPVFSNQWREGIAVSDHGVALLNWNILVLTVAALVLKLVLHTRGMTRQPTFERPFRKGAIATAVYVVFAISLAGIHKPIRIINMGTPEYIYGYTVAWTAEAISFDSEALLKNSLEKAEATSDRLTKIEEPLRFDHHVAVVQVESLDFDAIETKVNGEFVMPFLQSIGNQSMKYAVKPFHATGSSEADFSLLTTATPNGRVNPFLVHGFPYDHALPHLAQEQGYSSIGFHGNTGEFFHRRKAYRQMGFHDLYFTEELEPLDVSGRWDDELLQFSARLLNQASVPTFHFVITITSHGPFDRLPQEQCELFPDPANRQEHYLNSMRYVDRAIERYVARLPPRTTIVMYGDHESNVHGYTKVESQPDRVPWLIYRADEDLSKLQKSRDTGLACSGELTQLDMVCYLRDRFLESPTEAVRIARANKQPSKTIH